MAEKKTEYTIGQPDAEYGVGHVHEASRRRSSAVAPAAVAEEIFDERYETTQRGLKSRYVALPPLVSRDERTSKTHVLSTAMRR